MPMTTKRYKALRRAYQLHRASDSYLAVTGWHRSCMERRPIAADGAPLPWMPYQVAAFLDERLRQDHDVFEFGSGYSTLFLQSRVRSVTSVEHDRAWFGELSGSVSDNVQLNLVEDDVDGDYCRAIAIAIAGDGGAFDLVIVDGKDRINCMVQASKSLSSSGVILLDDSHWPGLQPGLELMWEQGFRSLHFEGMKPVDVGNFRTTIFYRDGNCLGI